MLQKVSFVTEVINWLKNISYLHVNIMNHILNYRDIDKLLKGVLGQSSFPQEGSVM